MLEFLPEKLVKLLTEKDGGTLFEIRIRADCSVIAKYSNKTVKFDKFVFNKSDIESVILKLCKNSIHTFEEQIKFGFITSDFGERVGLSGEFVKENGKITAIKNVTSLCVRVPNAIYGVSTVFYDKFYKKTGGSVLVLSPSGAGKTTYIRDLSIKICENLDKNVVIVDERNEIALKSIDKNVFIGKQVDVLTYSDKEFGFTQAIRTLNPSVIVTDELISENDVISAKNAVYSGVSVIATAHAQSVNDFFRRFRCISIEDNVFDYYIVISLIDDERNFEYYDSNLNKLCLF